MATQIKKCPKARRRTGKKAKAPVPHAPHDWVTGVYYPTGETDGTPVRCPGYGNA